MTLRISPAPDAQLNMTPMIDIVFQLILFFLFSLRFKSLDYRIESELPKYAGIAVTPKPVVELPHIRVSLVRLDFEDPLHARTKVKLAGSEWVLPDLATGGEDARTATFAAIEARIGQLRAAKDLPGEIDCPEPTGSLVPHGDVVRVLDSFLGAGITDVNFVGARNPLSHRR